MANVKSINSAGNVTRVEIEDHSDEVLAELNKKIGNALEAIGAQAEMHAKANCPVDTGRLRNSITFVTGKVQGTPNTSDGAPAEPGDYKKHAEPSPDTVYIGTNVEYAPFQEYFGKKAHFLRNAMTQHNDDYKKIVEAALKA